MSSYGLVLVRHIRRATGRWRMIQSHGEVHNEPVYSLEWALICDQIGAVEHVETIGFAIGRDSSCPAIRCWRQRTR